MPEFTIGSDKPTRLSNVLACIDGDAHSFAPLSPKVIYCTRCGGSVRIEKEKKK